MSADTERSPRTVRTLRTGRVRKDPVRTVRTDALRTTSATDHAVTALVSLCALTQFAIQAWLSYSFAREVWRIPGALCVAVIVALDLFVTVFMILTYLLRSAHLAVRAYAWLVLTGGIGAQLFAAELFAQHEAWALPVRTFAALPALFLAASLHGLIKYRQHTRRATDEQGRDPGPTAAQHQRQVDGELAKAFRAARPAGQPPVVLPPPERRVPPPAVPPVSSGRGASKGGRRASKSEQAALAVKRYQAGEAIPLIASDMGVSRRAVENWTRDYRTQRDAAGPATDLAAIAAEGALSLKANDPEPPVIQGDVAGHDG